MGCLQSKKESSDLHPNVFRVVNIDENGGDLCSGQLEISETDIILYREGRDSTKWPLHSLRRYGFEGEIFSFESGRRCETGEGIYAFRCRRAASLFRTLQQQIQLRNVIHESVPLYPVSRLNRTPSPRGRQTLQASVVHRSSIDNGQSERIVATNNNSNHATFISTAGPNIAQTPRSPILEVMPLNTRQQSNGNHITNVYQLREFKREHNNNQADSSDMRHVYSNDLSRDLALLRNSLRQETVLNNIRDIEDETCFLERGYANEKPDCNQVTSLSPTLSNCSEHYAQLSIEQQESSRLYMNISANDANMSEYKPDMVAGSVTIPKQVEYCNLSLGTKAEVNTYANLSLGEGHETAKTSKQILNFASPPSNEHNQKFSESDTFTSLSPVEELEVNYAVLDIDLNKENMKFQRELMSPESQSHCSSRNESTASCTSVGRARLVSQASVDPSHPAATLSCTVPLSTIGYTTIDFDKTVALTSVAAGGDIELDGPRRTRHNSSNVMFGSPSNTDKTKAN